MTDPFSRRARGSSHAVQLSAGGVGAGLLAVGVAVALLLVAAVWWGIRRRAAEPGR
ncbi:DUF6479 family protein [Streptomyces sp. NBC_00158]|uniref:DUF6479 family protein n=1 Tax=Streptomyces sp. NBC_00158 TaxID=2903627 RepID=UPI00324BAB19